jgi:hypothetical protein
MSAPANMDTVMEDATPWGNFSVNGKSDRVKVDPYYGRRDKLGEFLIQLKLLFKLDPDNYDTGEKQVMKAASLLKGPAFQWFEPTMDDWVGREEPDNDTKLCFHYFAEFERRIKKVFSTEDEARVAAREIYGVKQQGSAAEYYSRFHHVASKLRWEDENAFAEIFYNGLKTAVRREMMDPPKTYKKMVDEAIKIDNRLHELRAEDGYKNKRPGFRNNRDYRWKPTRNEQYGDPMDLDAMHGKGPSKGHPTRGRGRGGYHGNRNNRERERQKKDNLCFNCGNPGHRAKECKKTAQYDLHMMIMGDDITGSEAKKADTSEETQEVTNELGMTAQKGPQRLDTAPGKACMRLPPAVTKELLETCQRYLDEGKIRRATELLPMGALRQWAYRTVTDIETDLRRSPDIFALAEKFERQGALEETDPRHRDEPDGERQQQQIAKHASLSWTACYDDSCHIHYSDKMGSGWFPQRPRKGNRKNKKSRGVQERLAQEGDMIENGNDPHEEIYMMTQEPDELLQFVVVAYDDDEFILETLYWTERTCWYTDCEACKDGKKRPHPAFTPERYRQVDTKLVRVVVCNDKKCTTQGEHAHQGDDLIPIERPEETIHMMQEEHENVPWGRYDDKAERSTYTLEYNENYFTIITNRWVSRLCTQGECEPTQHQHLIYDPDAEPQASLKKVQFAICWDSECDEKENFHAHQWDEPSTIQLRMREETISKIRAMYEEKYPHEENDACVPVDDRAESSHPSKGFLCDDAQCPRYHEDHKHLLNVDPEFPTTPISLQAYQRMIQEGYLCWDEDCPWNEQTHGHLPKANLDMMTGSKYHPNIIENVVDERTDEDYIAEYFECYDKECDLIGKEHMHLHHVDPRFSDVAMTKDQFEKAKSCEDVECEWAPHEHVHWTKNDMGTSA